jgi:hypothetical protein
MNPQPASIGTSLTWTLTPDTNNFTIGSGAPTISGGPGTVISFQPTIAGDFVLAVYSGNSLLRTVQIAIVQAMLIAPNSQFTLSNTLAGTGSSGIKTTTTSILAPGQIPMYLRAWYLLQGGGALQNVGTSGIVIGDVGNLTVDSFQVDYPSTPDGFGTEVPGGSLPMLDTLRMNSDAGGSNVFRMSTKPADPGTSPSAPSAGVLLGIQSGDSPRYAWLLTSFGQTWDLTQGTVSFTEFIAGFSASFPQTYLALNQASWSLVLSGDNDAGWTPDGDATVTGNQQLGAASAAMQSRGPSYALSNKILYSQP